MKFEYDPNKSTTNEEKHGINFDTAKELWLDEDRVMFPAKSDSEEQWAMIALYNDRIWVAFYTIRLSLIRIISVRRARKNEIKQYYDC